MLIPRSGTPVALDVALWFSLAYVSQNRLLLNEPEALYPVASDD
jgi:hypothetical protein